jgi:toluene monooxygenase system protein E
MVAAYVGALAPSGRISVAAAFQAADELRRIQRLCQWLARSERSISELDALGRELWQQSPALQPLRRCVEQLLITYDWGEALLALNGALKPALERVLFQELAERARRQDDEVLEQTLRSLAEDGHWHAAWFGQLCKLLSEQDAANSAVIERTVGRWREATEPALQAFSSLLDASQRELAAV